MKNRWKLVLALLLSTGVVNAAYVTIGNAGNAADTANGGIYGDVAYTYNISATEVTIAEFQASGAGDGDENYWSAVGTAAPASNVSLYEAMKYCNYLTTADITKGYYSSSDGGVTYTVNALLSHDAYAAANGLTYFVPTEDEWYKAAYYTGSGAGGYSLYANGTGTAPVAGTDVNYSGSTAAWVVGTGTEEQNGTDDMMGNVWEWMENSAGVIRGGCNDVTEASLRSSARIGYSPSNEDRVVGFRVVGVVPEPATAGLLGISALVLYGLRRAKNHYRS